MRSIARPIAIALGLIAILLLGYAWYTERQDNADLKVMAEHQRAEISRLVDEQYMRENELYFYLMSESGEQMIRQIADAQTFSQRQRLASDLSIELNGFSLAYGAAEEIIARLGFLIAESDATTRADIASDLIRKIGDMAPFIEQPVQAIVTAEQGFAFITTLVAVLGSVGSAIASAFLFLTGSGRRKIEHDMLAVDLEKQKVELATMQYDAREAIAATHTPSRAE